jgi:hypothetical protein
MSLFNANDAREKSAKYHKGLELTPQRAELLNQIERACDQGKNSIVALFELSEGDHEFFIRLGYKTYESKAQEEESHLFSSIHWGEVLKKRAEDHPVQTHDEPSAV